MKVSTKTRYGLRIMLQLAESQSKEGAVKGKDIVCEQGISVAYMEQIMIKLRKVGWVITERGCRGGYKLNIAPEDITVLDLIELFEGTFMLASCFGENKRCLRLDKCKTAVTWRMLTENFKWEANKISLANIIELNSEIKEYVI